MNTTDKLDLFTRCMTMSEYDFDMLSIGTPTLWTQIDGRYGHQRMGVSEGEFSEFVAVIREARRARNIARPKAEQHATYEAERRVAELNLKRWQRRVEVEQEWRDTDKKDAKEQEGNDG